ncbi:archaetidylserine decarboxylase [Maribellus maritimus]|jgi:phosphatidylserine decarboxylase|uniref:archaetidylserine decarboxylase n=1 Tax=Maribellus maritimus TaxID=2870838 RepID=UPI001EECD114|nr:archaetidylserine decarboxylase [Maribellus maritimus]MCG6189825.1 archaetidylserine decarboxylase [Maribellus maritimus]MDD4226143.1 archaetidylserine decarboxylase [Mariniphaga sp.]
MVIKYIDRENKGIYIEHPPAEGLLKFLYKNPIGSKTILPIVKRKLITEWYGKMMDKPSSARKIKSFVDDFHIDVSELEKSIEEFKSFNDFFCRKLKPNARKIGNGLISPGDGRILTFENISDVNNFYIKGRKFTLTEFLSNKLLAEKYQNCSMVILRIAPNDYHRYHFPYSGKPSKSIKIKGNYYSVSPHALFKNYAKVFCENKREICSLNINKEKEILIVSVGSTMVGSINSSYRINTIVNKGEEMGYFSFGGSTVVLIFDPDIFKINQDLLENSKANLETFVKMGEEIAIEN